MTINNIFCIIIGFGLGFIFHSIYSCFIEEEKLNFDINKKETKKETKKDPADWWKYGEDPFEYE